MSNPLIPERIAALRRAMSQAQIDAWVIPSNDPHKSEYVADHWNTRAWISGFDGSAGTVLVTQDFAGLWTDSRYFLQAGQQLAGTGISLQKMKVQAANEYITWLQENLPSGSVLGIDGSLFGPADLLQLQKALESKNISIRCDLDLIAEIWNDRPSLPLEPIFEHDLKYAGKSRAEKLAEVRALMRERQADFHLVSTLDNIGWLYNLRGRDVHCNPVFVAHTLIGKEQAFLFIDERKVPEEIRKQLEADGIKCKSYEAIDAYLSELPDDQLIWIDPAATSIRHFDLLKNGRVLQADTASKRLKAMKNPVEIGHIRQCMAKDGAAITQAFMWLEAALAAGQTPREDEVAAQLQHFRSQMPGYFGESFDAIIGYKGNGAIIHYRPETGSSATIHPEGILLVDSGAQYTDGTTDITRTLRLGEVSEEIKKAYTLVLKGNIALSRAVFPVGTTGVQLDILARQHLWQHHMNYPHGTGHGVGFFMNVHEPPQGFAAGLGERGTTVHEIGMLSSNEPGLYQAGEFGIRIENLVIVEEAGQSVFGPFLQFETVTVFPIDTSLIDHSLMSGEEVQWLNQYHQRSYEAIAPWLNEQEQAWLAQKCQAI